MKYALVTGGGRGIGRAISVKLAEMGYYVLINFKGNEIEAKKTLALLKDKASDGELLRFDVANREEVDKILGGWLEKNPDKPIEVLINNAGIRIDNLFMWMKPEDWHSVLDISLNGFYNVTRLLISSMLVKKYGRIVNIASLSGQKGVPGQTNYSAAKAGLIGATKALAQEVGRRGVTANVVAPGFIKTDMTEGMSEADLKKLIPLNRFGEPEEVAEVVGFLASSKSSYITGEVIGINGGLYS
jgi:3-oxoacyl-[acyl-carrier protein] reductase